MKAKIEIPKGWRKLRNGEIIKAGDHILDIGVMEWNIISSKSFYVGLPANGYVSKIRRKTK
jgi:hypothetical protein